MSTPVRPPLSAAVLAGGQSRRMGSDKALIEFDGAPILARTIRILKEIADDVFVVGDREAYRRFGVPVLADSYPGAGALGGIATALEHATHDDVLIVACDMPFLRGSVLRAMALERDDEDVLVPISSNDVSGSQRYETLHAIYSRRCLGPILDRIREGDLRVTAFYRNVHIRELDERWLRKVDPDLSSLMNMNSPAELAAARERLDED
jgi:molybdenum cofactor guanylyltransferase